MKQSLELKTIVETYNLHLHFVANRIEKLPFIKDKFVLDLIKSQLKDFEKIISKGVFFERFDVSSLEPSFNSLDKSGILSIEELHNFGLFLKTLEEFKNKLSPFQEYEVREIFLDLEIFPNIRSQIERSITPDLEISSEASSLLASLRRRIDNLSMGLEEAARKAQKRYKDYLSDETISFKNGYTSISIKSSFKNKIVGLEMSSSNSGNTTFFAPQEVLKLTGEILSLKEEEQEEIFRIIKEMSLNISLNAERLKKQYKIAMTIDRLLAAIYYGKTYDGVIADTGDLIKLKSLGHPLIETKRLVRNDLILGDNEPRMLLISGPNAGGKTVLIKSVALAAIYNQSGLFVPCSLEAELPIFDDVFFLSGDNQSVIDNLSTFSSHVRDLKYVTDTMTKDSLVIIDEIGQGTSPLEGAALGSALFDLAKKIGCYLILTSHFDDLKDRSLTDKDILSAKMAFDETKIEPTYKVVYGQAGRSFGIAVAIKMGLSQDLIISAQRYIEEDRESEYKKNLDSLNERLSELKVREEALAQSERDLQGLIAMKDKELSAIRKKKQELVDKSEAIIEEEVEERLEELNRIWDAQKPVVNFGHMSKIKGELNKINSSAKKEYVTPAVQLQVGDRVRVSASSSIGQIKGKKGERFIVEAEGLNFTLKADQIELLPQTVTPKRPMTNSIDRLLVTRPDIGHELNLIGLLVDEAMPKLKKYLYDCLLMHFHQVRIIHGVGTGALQRATHKLLDSFKEVNNYRFGGEGEGGVGCTVVYFK